VVYIEQQHVYIRFYCKLGKNATATFEVFKAVYEGQTVEEYKFLFDFPSSKAV
jgi:hypothetical protein